ncbi:hypothetical protein P153DRAFT_94865 [Dothidotthia symphoricarpi CBS 119687]|uniref:C2H2-type domain-containing protein n=1 Tax=Dothidotthia symphoricarpi CBS 119687 TaxID=1392245 RepID=A0A6A6A211_9PLEO|nr:uncharacterized protein P153DRAFT_94865 [Dothidotthia symphoricarpi CBS 119687]KAF2125840.1 hypothetical protein P153DRAFT_94865 [Dothidotthia symphoricarpi CBS 119687]
MNTIHSVAAYPSSANTRHWPVNAEVSSMQSSLYQGDILDQWCLHPDVQISDSFSPGTSHLDAEYNQYTSHAECASNQVQTTKDTQQSSSPSTGEAIQGSDALPFRQSSPEESAFVKIATVYSPGSSSTAVFSCQSPGCAGRTFSRWPDFKRHYDGAHALEKTIYWCHVSECERSEADGKSPFPRKDKMKDHVRKVHSMDCP